MPVFFVKISVGSVIAVIEIKVFRRSLDAHSRFLMLN